MAIYQPPFVFEIAGIFMQTEFDQFIDGTIEAIQNGDVSKLANVLYYDNHIRAEQRELLLNTLGSKMVKVSLYALNSDILAYPHVKAWLIKYADYFNTTFEKSLKRKRSMEGDVTLLARWQKLIPQGPWQKHLDGDLSTWVNVPNKAVDTADIDALLEVLPNEHPKRSLLVAYRLLRAAVKEQPSGTFTRKEFALIVNNTHCPDDILWWNINVTFNMGNTDDLRFIFQHWTSMRPALKERILNEITASASTDIQEVSMPILMQYDADIQHYLYEHINKPSQFMYFDPIHIRDIVRTQNINIPSDIKTTVMPFILHPQLSDVHFAEFIAEYFTGRNTLPVHRNDTYSRYRVGALTAASQAALDRFFAEASDGYLMTLLMLTLMNQYMDGWYRNSYAEINKVQVTAVMASVAGRFTQKYPILSKMLHQRAEKGSTRPVIIEMMDTFVEHQVGNDTKNVYNMMESMYDIEHPFIFGNNFQDYYRMNFAVQNGRLVVHRLERTRGSTLSDLPAIQDIRNKAEMLQMLIAKNTATWEEIDVML